MLRRNPAERSEWDSRPRRGGRRWARSRRPGQLPGHRRAHSPRSNGPETAGRRRPPAPPNRRSPHRWHGRSRGRLRRFRGVRPGRPRSLRDRSVPAPRNARAPGARAAAPRPCRGRHSSGPAPLPPARGAMGTAPVDRLPERARGAARSPRKAGPPVAPARGSRSCPCSPSRLGPRALPRSARSIPTARRRPPPSGAEAAVPPSSRRRPRGGWRCRGAR